MDMKILTRHAGILCMTALTLITTGCVKDDLADSRLCGMGAVVLTADFSRHTADMSLPSDYLAELAGQTFSLPADASALLPSPFEPATATLIAFNEPAGMERSGMTIQVCRLADGSIHPMPDPLFTAKTDLTIPKDDTLRVTLPMQQRLFALRFELPVTSGDASLIDHVEGEVSGIAQAFDLDSQQVVDGTPACICLTFYREEAPGTRSTRSAEDTPKAVTFIGKAGLLGIDGQTQTLVLDIHYTDGQQQTITIDISGMMKDFGDGQNLEPLVITGGLEAPEEAGMEAVIKDWTVKDEEIEIK